MTQVKDDPFLYQILCLSSLYSPLAFSAKRASLVLSRTMQKTSIPVGNSGVFPSTHILFQINHQPSQIEFLFFILALPVRTWSVFAALPVSVPPDPPPTMLLTTVKSIYNTLQQVHRWTSLSVVPLLHNSYLLVLITSFMR